MKLLLAFLALWFAAVVPAQNTHEAAVEKLRRALDYGEPREIDKAVKDAPDSVLRFYEAIARDWTMRGDDEALKKMMLGIEDSWQRLFSTDTPKRIERWLSGLDPSDLASLDKLRDTFDKWARLMYETLPKKDRSELESLRRSGVELAKQLEQRGHASLAADAWGGVTQILLAMPDITLEERRDALFALEQFMTQRALWQHTKDSHYLRNAAWLKSEKEKLERVAKEEEKRREAGYQANAKGPEAYVMPGAKEEMAPLTFKMLTAVQDDLSIRGGPVPTLWLTAEVVGEKPSRAAWFSAGDLYLVWQGGNKYGTTLDASQDDQKKMHIEEIEASNRLKPSLFHLGPNKTRPYAMWFYLPSANEQLMGMEQNLAPRDPSETEPRRAFLYYKSAASWTAELAGETVTFYDDNANGKLFDSDPFAAGFEDTATGAEGGAKVPVVAYDTMRVGKGPLQPYSAYVQIGKGWFHLRPHGEGTQVGIRPLNPEFFKTGSLALKWTGLPAAKPDFLILRGLGEFSDTAFNIAGGKPVEVPAGEYEIALGRLVEGKGANVATATIHKGDSQKVTVEPEATTTVEIGGPFRLEFARTDEKGEVVIDSLRFQVKGKNGELYDRLNNAVVTPEVLIAKAADGKGAKPIGEFAAIPNGDILAAVADEHRNLGLEVGFFPIVRGKQQQRTVLREKVPSGMLVGLQQKKHRLFGKLDPVWK